MKGISGHNGRAPSPPHVSSGPQQGPGSDEDPIIVTHDAMVAMLTADDVHPQSNLSKNVLSGHLMFETDHKFYAVAAYENPNKEAIARDAQQRGAALTTEPRDATEAFGRAVLESAAVRHQSHVPNASRDIGDLVAEAMGLSQPK